MEEYGLTKKDLYVRCGIKRAIKCEKTQVFLKNRQNSGFGLCREKNECGGNKLPTEECVHKFN